MRAAEATSTEECPVKIKLVAPPLYVLTTNVRSFQPLQPCYRTVVFWHWVENFLIWLKDLPNHGVLILFEALQTRRAISLLHCVALGALLSMHALIWAGWALSALWAAFVTSCL